MRKKTYLIAQDYLPHQIVFTPRNLLQVRKSQEHELGVSHQQSSCLSLWRGPDKQEPLVNIKVRSKQVFQQ